MRFTRPTSRASRRRDPPSGSRRCRKTRASRLRRSRSRTKATRGAAKQSAILPDRWPDDKGIVGRGFFEMKILVSGICGFAGSSLATGLLDLDSTIEIVGFDNFSRAGSHLNIEPLRKRGVKLFHADVRAQSDLESI